MKILTKSDPTDRNRELLYRLDPPYRIRISLQVRNRMGQYRPLSGSILVDVSTSDEVIGLLSKLEEAIDNWPSPDDYPGAGATEGLE